VRLSATGQVMAKKATGGEVEWIDGVATTRVRVQGKRETFKLSSSKDEAQANERRSQLVELEKRMRGVDREIALAALRRVASATAGQTLRVACTLVDKLIGGWRPVASDCMTLGALADLWLSGELARRFPGDVRVKQSTGPARANLAKYILPTLGNVPVDAITAESCDAVKHSLGHLRSNSRRQVLAPLKVLLDYAVQPLRLIERSPLPPKWLPKEGDTRSLCWIYPSEDAQLMACTAVPLWFRVLVGYLIREGGRVNEPCSQSISQFDFSDGRNTATLEKRQTKTRKRRMWQLEAGTARALQRWIALRGADSSAYMFVNADGRKVNTKTIKLPELLRASLKRAGVARAELFANTDDERNVCVHDTRRSFVTVKLALGLSEGWISARTGHLTSSELRGYQEAARSFAELKAGDFLPLDVAIPELRADLVSDQPLTSVSAKPAQSFESPHSIVKCSEPSQVCDTAESALISRIADRAIAALRDTAGQSAALEAVCIPPAAWDALVARLTASVVAELRTDGVRSAR
jgi:integrase